MTGFTKTYKRERPEALVKAVDFGLRNYSGRHREIPRRRNSARYGRDRNWLQGGLRWTVGLEEQPAADGQSGMTLDENTVFVITGAAGSIVSAITADLAAASGGTFYLLDVVPEPDPNNPDLKRFASDKDGLKRELFARIQARGERATPALVERELAALERAQAARGAIDAVRAAGGTAHYFSVNLTDGEAVAKVMQQIRQRSGRIDVLLHAAGMERSHSCRKGPARIRPGLRRKERRLVPPAPRDRRYAARSDGGIQFHCRAFRQRRARRTTALPTTCCARSLRASDARGPRPAASRSTGPRGAASAWPPAARSQR